MREVDLFRIKIGLIPVVSLAGYSPFNGYHLGCSRPEYIYHDHPGALRKRLAHGCDPGESQKYISAVFPRWNVKNPL
jgi:hypothetical protein